MPEANPTAVQGTITLVLNRVVVYTALVAALPVLALALLVYFGTGTVGAYIFAAPVLAFFVVGLPAGIVLYNLTYNRLESALQAYASTLDQVAGGDLRLRLQAPEQMTGREGHMLAHLAQVMNRTLENFQNILRNFNRAMQRVEADTQAILDATSRQIIMANEQDAVVTETTATVNEVRATVTETAERAQSVAETAQLSVDISRNGLEAVRETVDGMEVIRRRVEDIADNILVLSEHTQQIGEIIATVNNLADQSRMLALNASVEAARAGEEGRGFAVVAMEVRNLADQNRDATVQVREILGEIQRSTNSAVMVTEEGSKGVDSGQQKVNKAGEAINELAKAIEDAAMAAMQIAASTRQQTIGMDQLTGAMRTIKHATTETVSSTMQVEGSVQRLRDAAGKVNDVLKGLKFEG
ncbi:MAG: methyl-accepting chemotaxis protein [Anaerolineae bacterium]|nr:methyl-accepting chemotaxis protein [Anaerolineae bacterium]